MRAHFLTSALFACALVSGCSRSGDFSTFIVAEVAKQGGHTVTNAPLPVVEAHWSVKSDANGFRAFITGAPFPSIDAVMQQAFGAPKMSVASNASGQPQRVWTALDIGVAIQLIGCADGADIICVRGMRDAGGLLQSREKRQ